METTTCPIASFERHLPGGAAAFSFLTSNVHTSSTIIPTSVKQKNGRRDLVAQSRTRMKTVKPETRYQHLVDECFPGGPLTREEVEKRGLPPGMEKE